MTIAPPSATPTKSGTGSISSGNASGDDHVTVTNVTHGAGNTKAYFEQGCYP